MTIQQRICFAVFLLAFVSCSRTTTNGQNTNVANLHRLPQTGFHIIALPMKIGGGSGGPLRIIAILDE